MWKSLKFHVVWTIRFCSNFTSMMYKQNNTSKMSCFCPSHFLRGYCTPTRKLACFVCFLLHREKNQYFLCMVVIDVCDSKSKSMIFFPWIYESLIWNGSKYFFLFNLRNHFKINRINSCFYYSWNHPFSVKKYIPMLKSSFTWLDLAIWSWPLFTIGDSNAPEITQNMYFFNIG